MIQALASESLAACLCAHRLWQISYIIRRFGALLPSYLGSYDFSINP
jgi:hypothetical protein